MRIILYTLFFTFIFCLTSTDTQNNFDDTYMLRDGLDDLCKSLTEWQEIMRKEGYEKSLYTKTGMEKYCPLME